MKFDTSLKTSKFFNTPNSMKYIMLHHTGSVAPELNQARYLALNPAQVSCHYVVGTDKIRKIAEDNKSTRHAWLWSYEWIKDAMNLHAIGIEVCSDWKTFSSSQKKLTTELVEYLMSIYSIEQKNVIRHLDYTSRKRDIGDNFWRWDFKTRQDYKNSLVVKDQRILPLVAEWVRSGQRPDDYATRYEVSVMIKNFLDRLDDFTWINKKKWS